MNFEAAALNFYEKRYVNYAYFSGIENNSRDKGIRGGVDEEVCCINCHRSMFNRSCFFSLLVQRKVVGMQCFRTVTMDWKRGFLLLLKS